MQVDDNIDAHLSKQQFGFTKNRGTVDAAFIARQVMEKANEHQVHFSVVDFKAAFDNLELGIVEDVEVYLVDPKITSLIEDLCYNTECAYITNGQLTAGWFRAEIEVRQGCLLLPILFSLFLEFVMAKIKSLCKELKLISDMQMTQ